MLATMQHSNTALLSSCGIQILCDSKTSTRDTCLLIPCMLPYYNLVILWGMDHGSRSFCIWEFNWERKKFRVKNCFRREKHFSDKTFSRAKKFLGQIGQKIWFLEILNSLQKFSKRMGIKWEKKKIDHDSNHEHLFSSSFIFCPFSILLKNFDEI